MLSVLAYWFLNKVTFYYACDVTILLKFILNKNKIYSCSIFHRTLFLTFGVFKILIYKTLFFFETYSIDYQAKNLIYIYCNFGSFSSLLFMLDYFKFLNASIFLKLVTISKSNYLSFVIVAACIIKALSINFFFNNHGI